MKETSRRLSKLSDPHIGNTITNEPSSLHTRNLNHVPHNLDLVWLRIILAKHRNRNLLSLWATQLRHGLT